jgi:paraquat-inducible protein B
MTTEPIHDAKLKQMKSISIIWLLPVVAILIGGWLVYYNWSTQGPLITISLASADGLEAGKTNIKSHSVNIGKVENISLNDKFNGVIVTARIAKHAEHLLVEDSQFWVVSPKITLSGVSGLGTLLSGSYIEFSQGTSNKTQLAFEALKKEPLTPKGTPGLHITLNSKDQFAYSVGDAIIYKGLNVGRFEDIYFNLEERVVYYNAFIKAPYHELITENTKFWNISGLSLDLNAEGATINIGSIETLLTNGVSFGVPDGMELGSPVNERDYFDIFPSKKIADSLRYKHWVKYVILVKDTIRGLKTGAPVEYRGVVIGQVLSTDLTYDDGGTLMNHDYKVPVLIGIQPGRIGLSDDKQGALLMVEKNNLLIKKGLKAILRTSNLLTGSLYIDLDHFDNSLIDEVQLYANYLVIPTMSDEFTHLTKKAGEFLESINEFDLTLFENNTNELIQELTQTAKQLQQVSNNLNTVLVSAGQEQIVVQLKETLANVSKVTQDFSSGSPSYLELQNALNAMTSVMHELSPLLNQLKNRPNGLIFDSGFEDKIQPKKHVGESK